jgi:hypothetical protein
MMQKKRFLILFSFLVITPSLWSMNDKNDNAASQEALHEKCKHYWLPPVKASIALTIFSLQAYGLWHCDPTKALVLSSGSLLLAANSIAHDMKLYSKLRACCGREESATDTRVLRAQDIAELLVGTGIAVAQGVVGGQCSPIVGASMSVTSIGQVLTVLYKDLTRHSDKTFVERMRAATGQVVNRARRFTQSNGDASRPVSHRLESIVIDPRLSMPDGADNYHDVVKRSGFLEVLLSKGFIPGKIVLDATITDHEDFINKLALATKGLKLDDLEILMTKVQALAIIDAEKAQQQIAVVNNQHFMRAIEEHNKNRTLEYARLSKKLAFRSESDRGSYAPGVYGSDNTNV